ncbi:hypothetical protein FA13DRAFT_1792486 [Coprinellus micaceus]|uniref:Uncharacterized protein n=1 Tax=Coprinellus micaceus TaxID=71717 RepID=A0A4Y7TA95_COPMI|nr:hypothetical protein FA13DRAFT_1792486 [Coprinellus micaceus]
MPILDSDDDQPVAQSQCLSRLAKDTVLVNKAWLADKLQSKSKKDKPVPQPNHLDLSQRLQTLPRAQLFQPAAIDSASEDDDDDDKGEPAQGIDEGSGLSEEDDDEFDNEALAIKHKSDALKIDHNCDPASPSKKHQSKTLSLSPPASTANLFDNDNNDNVDPSTPPLVHKRGQKKCSCSVSPEVQVDDDEVSPVKPRKKSCRDEVFKQEKPHVKTSPLKKKLAALSPCKRIKSKKLAATTTATNTSSSWPIHASLVYNPGTEADVPLLCQHPLVRRVGRSAIKAITERLVLHRAVDGVVVTFWVSAEAVLFGLFQF